MAGSPQREWGRGVALKGLSCLEGTKNSFPDPYVGPYRYGSNSNCPIRFRPIQPNEVERTLGLLENREATVEATAVST
jgi:hypothetical protein